MLSIFTSLLSPFGRLVVWSFGCSVFEIVNCKLSNCKFPHSSLLFPLFFASFSRFSFRISSSFKT